MATTFNFGDRFSYPAENGVGGTDATEAQSLSDAQLEAESPELAEMASMVRAYSILVSRRPTLEIFNIITTQADPRIALILSAAKRREDNQPLFGGLGAVKEIMYADPARVPAGTGVVNRNLFSDGIRRVSAALTASILIGQLSQIKEQAEHSKILETQALRDLEQIVETYDLAQQTSTSSTDNTDAEDAPVAFYFETKELEIPAGKYVKVEWQSPGLSSQWSQVGEFTGTLQVFDILLAIVDDLNTQTILNPETTLLAAAELAGPYFVNPQKPTSSQYHTMLFYPRKPTPGTVAFSINVRIQTLLQVGGTDSTPETYPLNYAPFIWGPQGESLNNFPVNGSLVVTRYNKISTSSSGLSTDDEYTLIALYIRSNSSLYADPGYEPPQTSQLIYRVQPWQPVLNNDGPVPEETITVDIVRLTDDDPVVQRELDLTRFSQIAVELINSLANISLETRVTGAIIRNDPTLASGAAAAVELIAWSASNVITHIVLDILQVPPDIEIAVGDRLRPRTLYSANPKSLHVKNPFSTAGTGPVDGLLRKEQAYVLKKTKPRLWKTILDEATTIEDPLWR
jgi:hypothetical protein